MDSEVDGKIVYSPSDVGLYIGVGLYQAVLALEAGTSGNSGLFRDYIQGDMIRVASTDRIAAIGSKKQKLIKRLSVPDRIRGLFVPTWAWHGDHKRSLYQRREGPAQNHCDHGCRRRRSRFPRLQVHRLHASGMSLTLIEGPAGAGKSGVTALMLSAGEIQVLADVTELWAALSGAGRDAAGRYPVRLDDDPALAVARYIQVVAVRQALQDGADVGVTTSRRNRHGSWRRFAEEAGVAFIVRTG